MNTSPRPFLLSLAREVFSLLHRALAREVFNYFTGLLSAFSLPWPVKSSTTSLGCLQPSLAREICPGLWNLFSIPAAPPFHRAAFSLQPSAFSLQPSAFSRVLLTPALALIATCHLFAAGGSKYPFLPVPDPATNITQVSTSAPSQVATNALAAGVTNGMDALDDKHKLAIGDRLSFRIEEDQEDPKPLFVTDSGDLEVPYIGRFPAVDKTCKQLARELKAALEKEYYYQATVIVAVDLMTKSRGKVYLVGPVRMPGPQEIPSDEVLTLSKAILRAGGFTDFADKKNVKITRQESAGESGKVTLVVDVGQIFDKGKTENDVALKPGDLIYIPERMIRF